MNREAWVARCLAIGLVVAGWVSVWLFCAVLAGIVTYMILGYVQAAKS